MTDEAAPPILMVDDNTDDFLIAEIYYADAGLPNPLVHLLSGDKFLAYIDEVIAGRAVFPFFVLLDINMPRMNGFETLEALRQTAIEPPPIVMMLTTSARPEDRARAEASGASDYLVKPMDGTRYVEMFKELHRRFVADP